VSIRRIRLRPDSGLGWVERKHYQSFPMLVSSPNFFTTRPSNSVNELTIDSLTSTEVAVEKQAFWFRDYSRYYNTNP